MEFIGASSLGLALLGIGAWMLWRKKSRKLVTWLWLAAGFGLSGGLATVLSSVISAVGGAGARMFGVGLSVFMGIAGVIALLEVWHGAHPKSKGGSDVGHGRRGSGSSSGGRGATKVYHPGLALAAPLLLGASGGTLHQLVIGLAHLVGGAGSPVSAFFGG